MSTAATNPSRPIAAAKKPVTKPKGAAAPAVALPRDPAVWVMVGLLSVAFVAQFWRWFAKQYGPDGFSIGYPQDWGHAYLVPLISGFFIWKERARIAALPRATFWPGLLLIVVGVVSYPYFVIAYSNHMFQGAAMLLALGGVVLLLFGPRIFGAVLLPIAYLGFAVTISERIMIEITFRLQLLAAQGSWLLLNIIGVDTDLEGNVLYVFNGSTGERLPLNVAEACAGMRMVIAFVALAAAVALFSVRRWWKRVAVLLIAPPVAVLMNVVRVAVLGLLSLVDPALAQGEAHMLIGTVLLVPAFGLFLLCVWALNKIEPEEAAS